MRIRPEGKRLGDEMLTRQREASNPHSPVSGKAPDRHQPHGDERTEISREGRGVHREHFGEAPHHAPRLAAHRNRVEQGELRGLDTEGAKSLVVEAGDDARGATSSKAEAVPGHCGSGAAVRLHEKMYIQSIPRRQGM